MFENVEEMLLKITACIDVFTAQNFVGRKKVAPKSCLLQIDLFKSFNVCFLNMHQFNIFLHFCAISLKSIYVVSLLWFLFYSNSLSTDLREKCVNQKRVYYKI